MTILAALNLALSNPIKGLSRHGAVLFHRGRPVAYGLNKWKTHPLMARFGRHGEQIHLHAEIDALRNVLRTFSLEEITQMTMYVGRVLRDGTPANSKPCEGCEKTLIHFGITDIQWSE